jgi:hypothetical protein
MSLNFSASFFLAVLVPSLRGITSKAEIYSIYSMQMFVIWKLKINCLLEIDMPDFQLDEGRSILF